jgi:hypothetical protein
MSTVALGLGLLLWNALKPERTDLLFLRAPTGRYLVVQLYPHGLAVSASTSRPAVFPLNTIRDPATQAHIPRGWGFGRTYFNVDANGPAPWPWAPHSLWNRLGFWNWPANGTYIAAYDQTINLHKLVVPRWLVLITLAMPAVMTWRLRRRRRRLGDYGFCPRCGYDLCASFETCPECGEPVVQNWAC